MYTRITKKQAKQRFNEGKEFYIIPCKMRINTHWHSEILVNLNIIAKYKDYASWYTDHPTLWKGDLNSTAWDLMYNNWRFYSTNYEMGYYAHYYIKE